MKKNNLLTDKLIQNEQEINIDYSEELQLDAVLEVSKKTCYAFLEDEEIQYSKEEINTLFGMCSFQYDKLSKVKKSLKIKKYSNYNVEIAKSLDSITLGDSVLEKKESSHYLSICKDINAALTQLKFCILILNSMLSILELDQK